MRNEAGTAAGAGMGGLFLGILIGAVVGGITALLLAPKSGKETRDIIRGKATRAQQMVQSRFEDIKGRVSQIKETVQSKAEEEARSVETRAR